MSESTPTSDPSAEHDIVIIGAGPAGLTAAYMLTKRGNAPTVLESDDVVGGISRTAVRDGWRFDIGGHRFFTKVARVRRFWDEVLPDDECGWKRRRWRRYHDRWKRRAGRSVPWSRRRGRWPRCRVVVRNRR